MTLRRWMLAAVIAAVMMIASTGMGSAAVITLDGGSADVVNVIKHKLIDNGIEVSDVYDVSEVTLINGEKFTVIKGNVNGSIKLFTIDPNGEISPGIEKIIDEKKKAYSQLSKAELKLDKKLQKVAKGEMVLEKEKIPVFISVIDKKYLQDLKNHLRFNNLTPKAELQNYLLGISADVNITILNELVELDYVSTIYFDSPIEMYLDASVPTIRVNGNNFPSWTDNTLGSGITVAIVDRGVDIAHPDISRNFGRGSKQKFPNNNGEPYESPHGTAIAGIIASNDETYKGVAPGVSLLDAMVTDQGGWEDVAQAIEWAVNKNADIITMSIGGHDLDGLSRFVDAVAFQEDVVFTVAVGQRNNEFWEPVVSPADAYNVISVGAIDDHNDNDLSNDILYYNAFYGTNDGRQKPDILVPGVNIFTTMYDWEGGTLFNDVLSDGSHVTGTSYATPHVAGVAAILLSKNHNLSAKQVKAILLNTANKNPNSFTEDERARAGYGLVNANEANRNIYNSLVGRIITGQKKYYKLTPESGNIITTMVWERHVSERDPTIPDATVVGLSDLDMYLYKEGDNSLIANSASLINNVEQIVYGSNSEVPESYVLKIVPMNLINQDETFALAYYGTADEVTPPLFSSSVSDLENVALGSTFTVSVTVANYGDIDAHNVQVNLNLPDGLSLVSGSNPTSLDIINPFQSKTAYWVVRAESLGTKSIGASINSDSYVETFTATALPSSLVVYENNPPNPPTDLLQWDSVGATVIPFGGITDESTVLFDGMVSDPDNDDVQLEVEVKPIGTAFTGIPTCVSGPAVASGSTAFATCISLADGQYHWQARAKDSNGASGPWQRAGENPETSPDFEIRSTGRSGGPDDFGYTFKDSNTPGGPTYEWIEISGTGTPVLPSSDDSVVSNINLGFFFNYYGTDYSRIAIANNGLLFSAGTTWQYVNDPITQSPRVHGFIAPFWDDLVTWGSGTIYYQTLGTAPNRKFVVEWYNNQHYRSSSSGVTFEAILYEGSNNIKFQYKDVDFGTVSGSTSRDLPPYNNGGSATVGIEGPTGDIGLQYSFNEQVISPGLAILFKFPQYAGTNLYLSKQAPASKDRGSTMTYNLYYHNFGDTAAQNVVLEDTLPPEVEFISASDGGSYNPNTRKVTWNIGSVAPGGHGYENVTVRIRQNVTIGNVTQNNASINTSSLEVRYDDNEAHAQTRVTGSNLPPDVSVEPNNGGTTPSVYWGTPITFSYHSCDTATGVDIRIHIDGGGSDITGSMSGGPPDWTYTTTFYPRHGHATITYTIYGCDQNTVSFDIYIDPAGYIYYIDTGERIAGATVWLQRPDGTGGWENVPTGETPAIMQPDVNPLITNTAGQYQWDVLEGSYRVHVEASGYYPADSIVVSIPPPVTDLHVGLTRLPDTTPPASVTDLQNITFAQTYINWTWTNPTDLDFAKVMVYLNGIFQTNVTVPTDYYNATGLAPDTQYTISTHTVDTSGNINQIWVNHTARTAPIDTTPPVLTNVGAASDIDSAVITWDTDEASDSLVKYGTSSGNYPYSINSSVMTTSHSLTLTGLAPGTIYYCVVNSTDAQGNSNESTEHIFTTLAPADTAPPTIESVTLYPANTTAGAIINISVAASDNVEVAEVTADGTPLTYSDGLWNGSITAASSVGNYTLLITARDAAGNTADTSAPYRVVLREGGASISVVPGANNVIAGDTVSLNIKVKNTQNIDDVFRIHINVSELPSAYQADITWFEWTEEILTVRSGEEVIIPLSVTIPSGVSGTKVFRAKANSIVSTTYAFGTGYLIIS